MRLVNLTPHPIVIAQKDSPLPPFAVPPSGQVARVATATGYPLPKISPIEDDSNPWVPVFRAPTYGPVEGLPDPQPGVGYIVSAMVLDRVRGRADVFAPGTGPNDEPIREGGQIKAVTRLISAS